MKVCYIACAAGSSVDHKTNELSLFQVLDEVGAEAFPLRLPSLCVATLFEREAGETASWSYVMTIGLDDALIASFALQVEFGAARRTRCVNTVKGVTIPRPGRVFIRLLMKSEVLADWSFVALSTAPDKAHAAPATPRLLEPAPSLPRGGPTVN